MICHIKLGKLSWCKMPYSQRPDLAIIARDEGLFLTCSHVSTDKAERMVRFLHRYGVDFARVVMGACAEAPPANAVTAFLPPDVGQSGSDPRASSCSARTPTTGPHND
jgi:hypothetical protein